MGKKLKAVTSFIIIIMLVFLSISGDFGTLHFGAGKAYADTWTLEAVYFDCPSYHDRDIIAGLYDQCIVFGAKMDGSVELYGSIDYDPMKTYRIATDPDGEPPVSNIGDYFDSNDYAVDSDDYALEKYVMTYNGSDYSGYQVAEQGSDGGYIYVFSKPASSESVKTPSFNPAAGTYASTQSVTITSETAGSTIYYTTDGTAPTTASTVYSAPIPVAVSCTIKTIAVKSGMTNSDVGSATYTILGKVATPTFSPTTGTYTGTQSVTITSATAGTTIYYTSDGTTPTTSSTVYSAPILVTASSTIKAIAVKSGMTNSDIGSATYTILEKVATPTFSPTTGTYTGTQSVTITSATAGTTIYYTTDGTTPTISSTVYSAPILVTASSTIKAIAVKNGMINSDVGSATYTISGKVATPTFSPTSGTYIDPQSITITSATAGTTIYYTTDGTTPTTASTVYSAPILVSASSTIKAIAVKSGMTNSDIGSATYTIQNTSDTWTLEAVYFDCPSYHDRDIIAGLYDQYIVFGAKMDGSVELYGSVDYDPTLSYRIATSKEDGEPPVSSIGDCFDSSDYKVDSADYALEKYVMTYNGSDYSGYQVAEQGSDGGYIYVFSKPTSSASVKTPSFNPAAGTYASTQSVTITSGTAGSTIYYTTDGSTPTTASTVYSAPILVSASSTIKAIAVKSGMTNSNVGVATYTILGKVVSPTFSPTTGTYIVPQSVTIACATSGSTIYFTTDGTTPTTASTVYSAPILVSASSTIKAIAVKSGMTNSDVGVAIYTISGKVASPTFSPTTGTYAVPQSVTITCATSGSTIYFTKDGTTPTTASTVYSTPISVTTSSTIKAIAVKNGMLNSDIAIAVYTILNNNCNYEYKYLNNRLDEIRVNGMLIMKYEYDNNGNLIKATKVN